MAVHVTKYAHGVIDSELPGSNIKLRENWALQHPADYLDVLKNSVPKVIRQAGVMASEIVGIGISFTSCTMLPVNAELVPLCLMPEYAREPHSWVKLWKHHAAEEEAAEFKQVAENLNEAFLSRYGGTISSEWMIPKIWQVLKEAPEIYGKTYTFIEAADWIVSQLTGRLQRSSCTTGYKAIWHKQEGYPDTKFFRSLDSRLENVVQTKLKGEVVSLGNKAGELTAEMASLMGLREGIAIAASVIDAHAGVLGTGVVTPGKMVMAIGTSTCHMLLSESEKHVEGISGVVEDGIVPGYFGYEAGQPAVGDIFSWFVQNGVPARLEQEAMKQDQTIFQWLGHKASKYLPGETGLLALDWWNGNRSVLVDYDLSGMILGYTLKSKPEEIYRALLEASAFGTRKIIDSFIKAGVAVEELYACGGLSKKNPLFMQILADVTGYEIKIADSEETSALGQLCSDLLQRDP